MGKKHFKPHYMKLKCFECGYPNNRIHRKLTRYGRWRPILYCFQCKKTFGMDRKFYTPQLRVFVTERMIQMIVDGVFSPLPEKSPLQPALKDSTLSEGNAVQSGRQDLSTKIESSDGIQDLGTKKTARPRRKVKSSTEISGSKTRVRSTANRTTGKARTDSKKKSERGSATIL